MKRLILFVGVAAVALIVASTPVHVQVSFPGTELLGRPTSSSITLNIVASTAIDAYVDYGTTAGSYPLQTAVASAAANEPLVTTITGLQADTQYYYRLVYRPTGGAAWTTRDEHTFHTQRAPGSTFTFTITSDSHIDNIFGDAALFQTTLQNALADHPDFHLDLGDTFPMDGVTTQAAARTVYLNQRQYFGLLAHSAPVFLALGNHADEEAWHLDDTGNVATSTPVLSANARKRYFLNPVPDAFYTGNTDVRTAVDGDHLIADYYAWTWGDALFVVIDPYWYTTTKPFTGNTGGGEASDPGSGDRWDWTLGWDQYAWLKQTLEASDAKYKFIFTHNVAGGTDDYGRGGANAAPFVEWGGYNEDGATWAFDARRPGWPAPVHQLLTANHVTVFFHGHDHEFAYEQRDGLVYQLVPMAADSTYGFGFQNYHETDPYTTRVLPNSGHLRVTVSPAKVTVDYVRAFLSGSGTNDTVAYSYDVGGSTADTTPPAITAVAAAPTTAGTATLTWTTNEASTSRVDYGTTTALGSSASSPTLVTAHSVQLTGLTPGATYYYTVTSADAAGNSATASAGTPLSFTVPTATGTGACPCSLWTMTTTPGGLVPDPNGVELGVKFRADVAGTIVGLRFYKYPQNTGTHVGSIWNTSGTRLGTVTFAGETSSGWQQATFSSPITIAANTTYIASYFTPTGYYAATEPGFSSAIDNAPLHALADAASGGNGVYRYGSASAFPNQTWDASNYWVDVVFQPSAPPPPDTTPPTITSVAAAPTMSGTSTVTWATNEASTSRVDYGATTALGSTASSPTLVTAHSVQLTGLTPGATYYYTVTSADAANNSSTAPTGTPASFTVPVSTGTGTSKCPCSLWTMTTTPGELVPDPNGVELGVKFRADVAGTIVRLRFYKYAQNTGTHVGSVWSTSGTRLGTVTFTGETASGWQEATITPPIAVAANTTYIASYFTPTGYYAVTEPGFNSAIDNVPLHALADSGSGGNGVYRYGSASAFPNQTWDASNYWVDVVFQPTDTTAPTVSSVAATPATAGTATITWTTNEASSSRVDYGTTPALGSTASTATLVTAHSAQLTGLTRGSTYYYTVTSADAAANSSTSPSGPPASFTVP